MLDSMIVAKITLGVFRLLSLTLPTCPGSLLCPGYIFFPIVILFYTVILPIFLAGQIVTFFIEKFATFVPGIKLSTSRALLDSGHFDLDVRMMRSMKLQERQPPLITSKYHESLLYKT